MTQYLYSCYTNSTKTNVISVCVCVTRLKRRKTSTSRGMEKTYEAASNEAPHMILGYHQGRLMTYLLYMAMVMKQMFGSPFWFSCFQAVASSI